MKDAPRAARLRRRANATRVRFAALVVSGLAVCARCGLSIAPGAAWDLGHTEDRTGYSGPEHRKCNQLAGARKGAAVLHAQHSGEASLVTELERAQPATAQRHCPRRRLAGLAPEP